MAEKYFAKAINTDATCDADTPFDMSKTHGSTNTVDSRAHANSAFEEALSFDINVSGDSPATADVDVSLDVAAIDAGMEYRFRAQAVDDAGCGISASTVYSSIFSSVGIKTLSATSLTWAAGDDRLRLSVETRKVSGHGNLSITVNANDADSFVNVPDWPSSVTTPQTVGEGTVSPLGALLKKTSKFPGVATVSPLGALSRKTSKVGMGGFTVSPTGVLSRKTSKAVGGASVGPLGALSPALVKLQTVGGHTLGPTGALGTLFIPPVPTPQAVGGATVSPLGALTTAYIQPATVGGATVSPTGALVPLRYNPTGPPVFALDPSLYDPPAAFFLEAVLKASAGTAYARLWNVTDNVEVMVVTVTATNYTRVRSAALTLPNALKEYRLDVGGDTGSAKTNSGFGAWIRVKQ